MSRTAPSSVMPGLAPGIHVLPRVPLDVDGRDEPGHDAWGWRFPVRPRPGVMGPGVRQDDVVVALQFNHALAFPRRVSPGVCHLVSPPTKTEGAGKTGCPHAPMGLRAKGLRESAKPQVQADTHRPSLRSGLRLIRALLGEPCRLPPSSAAMRSASAGQLDASLWGARTTRFRSSVNSALVSQRFHVHRIPASHVVTIAMRPSWVRRDARRILPICRICKTSGLRQIGTTGNLRMADMRVPNHHRHPEVPPQRGGPTAPLREWGIHPSRLAFREQLRMTV